MSNLFTITIPDSAAGLLVTYGAGAVIRVQSSPTEAGAFGDIPNPTQPIVTGVETYPVYDADGLANDWYRFRYEAADGDPVGAYSTPTQPVPEATIYASLATFKSYVRTESTDDDDLLGLALAAASRAIDLATNRTFATTIDAAEARYFNAVGGVVQIDGLMDGTGLTVEYDADGDQTYESAIDAANIRLEPIGAVIVGKPYTRIVATGLPDGSTKVTALWGWTAIPPTIQKACLLQASRIWHRRNAPFGVAGSPEMGNELRLLAKLDPDVELMVASFINWWGAA